MKKLAVMMVAMMLLILAVVPVTVASAQGVQMFVNTEKGGHLNFRTAPNTKASVIKELGQGYPVTLVSHVNSEWDKVTARISGKDVTGYVARKFVTTSDPARAAQTIHFVNAFNVRVAPTNAGSGYVNLLTRPNCDANVIARLHQGQVLSVIGESKTFYEVIDGNGNVGYVVKAFVNV